VSKFRFGLRMFRQTSIQTSTPIRHFESFQLAYSLRVFQHLLRTGKIPPSSMALTTVEPGYSPKEKHTQAPPPPDVVTTPCDPWPRPYYLEGGLRRVYPYHFTYNTFCKERWRGRGILEIFASEFRDRPTEYYVRREILFEWETCWLILILILGVERGYRNGQGHA
jgi:hypothetical protein